MGVSASSWNSESKMGDLNVETENLEEKLEERRSC